MPLKKKHGTKIEFQHIQMRILIIYITIIFFVVVFISAAILYMAGQIMTYNADSLISANCRQIELNISKYLEEVELTTTLLFADKDYYTFDTTDPSVDEYTRIKKQEMIRERISDLALIKNFSDFATVYADGERAGWVSSTVSGIYGGADLYEELEKTITNEKRKDGWSFGMGGTCDRMFYAKRLNENTILMAAFYSREMENVFEFPEELEGMSVSLINDDGLILYSVDPDRIGTNLEGEIRRQVDQGDYLGETYIVNVNTCENGWRVVCAMPRNAIYKGYDQLLLFATIMSVVLGLVFAFGGTFIMRKTVSPFDKEVSNLEIKASSDRLTGLYNKLTFQDMVGLRLKEINFGETQAFIMLDMDFFKTINDTLGHSYGDDVLKRLGKLLKENFDSKYIVGRLGGDEFAIYAGFEYESVESVRKILIQRVEKLRSDFIKEYKKERETIKVSLSIGICVQNDERRFEELYKHADEALYNTKKNGKDGYSFYENKDSNLQDILTLVGEDNA